MTTEISTSQLRFIPVRQLTLSPLNVRKTGGDAGIAELAQLIEAEGLLQNLSVYECHDDEPGASTTYAVIAGGRRWRALQLLIKEKRITPEYAVPCLVVSYERAVQISLTENSSREPMHPADEFEAFRQLIEAGQSIEDVAARFGVTPLVVQRRLKLANVHPSLIALYREGEITLECLMAFTITDDHARQLEVWEGQKAYERSPESLRAALTEHEVSVRRSIARFVGLKAYEKAGGVVRRDLFAEENEGVLLDAVLVRRLATEKLERCAQKLRKEGIPWVHVRPELDYAERAAYRGVNTVYRDPTEEERKALDDIVAERNRIESEIDEAQDDERAAALERQAEELDQQEEALKANLSMPDPDQQALAGALISIGADGKARIERDLLKPEDASRFQQGQSMRGGTAGDAGPRVHSAVLVRSLTAQRTLALQATLMQRPDVALAALTHRLLLEAFPLYGNGPTSALRINTRHADLAPHAEEIAGCPAEVTLQARCAAERRG